MHISWEIKMASEIVMNEEKPEEVDHELFENAMKGHWDKVVEVYQKNSKARTAKLTKSEDTALHLAVSNGHTDIVVKLVDSIPANEASNILEIKNGGGNTPLHIAAIVGNEAMCVCIAQKHPDLIAARNAESETPLFLAAHLGKQEAFFCLHDLWENKSRQESYYTPCRKSNGDTILHTAIFGEYFSLAYQILSYYPDLVNYVNENGSSPLHILAGKPNVFSSSSPLRLIDRIIYHCVFVDELKKESHDNKAIEADLNEYRGSHSVHYPENYRTCTDIYKLLRNSFQVLTSLKKDGSWKSFLRLCWEGSSHSLPADRSREKTTRPSDEEDPYQKSSVSQGKDILGASLNAQRSGSRNDGKQARREDDGDHSFPPNYSTCLGFFKLVMKALLIILGLGIGRVKKITEKKEKHVWAHQIMNELVEHASTYKYDYNGRMPHESQIFKDGERTEVPTPPSMDDPDKSLSITTNSGNNSLAARKNMDQNKKDPNGLDGTDKRDTPPGSFAAKIELINVMDKFLNAYPDLVQVLNSSFKDLRHLQYEEKQMHDYGKRETPLLIAAKMGIVEMVEKILCTFPVAIQDLDSNKKNVVLLAVENRQAQVYNLLLKGSYLKESVLRQVDDQGNSALHLASMFGDHQPWLIPGAALQMQWEIKWYRFVKHSMPPQFFVRYNKRGENPSEIFTRTHQKLVKNGSKWLIKTSESCSVVAALIATVAFATSATVPGGANQETGVPILESEPAFVVFSISSLIALCFSVTALVFFLAILTSRCQEKDFHKDLPRKLLLGLTSLFASIASMLVSFCAAHFFLLKDKLKSATFPIYALTCLPVTFFAFAQITLYGDLIWAILTKVPQRSYKVFPH